MRDGLLLICLLLLPVPALGQAGEAPGRTSEDRQANLQTIAPDTASAWNVTPTGERIVATVNGVPITEKRFNTSYVQKLIQTGANDTPEARYAHLHELIDGYLFGEEARRRGLDDGEFQRYINIEIKKVVGGRFFERAFVDSLPEPTEQEIRDAFRKENENVVLRHLFFRDPNAARATYERLQHGEDFVVLANEVFETSEFDSSAGLLGEAGYWDLDDSVAVAVWDLLPGAYTVPVRSKFGWHILRVENRLRNPLLTEDAFQLRRDDLRFRVRTRRFRLGGDRFVRSFMDSLDVEVNVEAMEALRNVILQHLPGGQQSAAPRVSLHPEEVVSIEREFSGESVLATYELNGERHEFRARQYFEWLEHLPFNEVRNRTAASVGRALRNEALAERGISLGLQHDPAVRDDVQYLASMYLDNRLREKMRREADIQPSEAELREAYDRLGYRKLARAEADFWLIEFASFPDAQQVLDSVRAGVRSPESYDGFVRHEGADLTDLGELGSHVRKALVGSPVVVGTGDGSWYLLGVEERTIDYVEFDEARDAIERRIRPFIPELHLTRELREKADIYIDHEFFREMMDLRRSKAGHPSDA